MTPQEHWDRIVRAYERARGLLTQNLQPSGARADALERLVRDLAEARSSLGALCDQGLLSDAERDLVDMELMELTASLESRIRTLSRPVAPACYAMVPPAEVAKDALERRLRVLERISVSHEIHPEALRLVRSRLEATIRNPLLEEDEEGRVLREQALAAWRSIQERLSTT